jgi:hypothetical protein
MMLNFYMRGITLRACALSNKEKLAISSSSSATSSPTTTNGHTQLHTPHSLHLHLPPIPPFLSLKTQTSTSTRSMWPPHHRQPPSTRSKAPPNPRKSLQNPRPNNVLKIGPNNYHSYVFCGNRQISPSNQRPIPL